MLSSVSTQYLSSLMARIVATTQTQLASAQSELASGKYQDMGLHLGWQAGFDASLKDQDSRLQALIGSNSLSDGRLSAAQSAINTIRASAQDLLGQLAVWTPANQNRTLKEIGAASLDSFISTANTAHNGQFVFGGINSATPPLKDYSAPQSLARSALLAAFTARFGFSPEDPAAAGITPAQLQSFLDTDFAHSFDKASWSADWSNAASENVQADISPGRAAAISVNANEAGFRDFAQAGAMLSVFGGTGLSSAALSTVASSASALISRSAAEFTSLEAGLGATQAKVTAATESMKSQSTLLQAQINRYEQADPYATATSISLLTTRLQASYQLTAQLQQLSLVKYLPN